MLSSSSSATSASRRKERPNGLLLAFPLGSRPMCRPPPTIIHHSFMTRTRSEPLLYRLGQTVASTLETPLAAEVEA